MTLLGCRKKLAQRENPRLVWQGTRSHKTAESRDPDPRRFGRKHFGCHDSCPKSRRPRDEKSVDNEMHNNMQDIWIYYLRQTLISMAENTSTTSITEEDPFNEDEVRWEFWRQSETTCWKLVRVAFLSSLVFFHLLAFVARKTCI